MSFGQAVKSVLRQYATFSGRARRSEFWWFFLAVNLMQVVLIWVPLTVFFFAVVAASSSDSRYGNDSFTMPTLAWVAIGLLVIGFLASLATTIPYYAVQARRLHDMGQSAHWIWLNFVSLGIVPLIMCVMEGNAYHNQHGSDPKAKGYGSADYPAQGFAQTTYAQPGYPAQPTYAQPSFPQQPGYPAVPPPPTPPAPSPGMDDPFSSPGN